MDAGVEGRGRVDPAMPRCGRPSVLLRLEGGGLLVLAIVLYARLDSSWLLVAGLALAPDLTALGYGFKSPSSPKETHLQRI